MAASVFVFGSNLRGIHGAGAALHAARWLGAVRGQGEGPMGGTAFVPSCYAVATKADPRTPLPKAQVESGVGRFLDYASAHSDLTYQVTRLGCGLAGFSDAEIAPLFDGASSNCRLPGLWLARRDDGVARVIVAGSRTITDRDFVWRKIEATTRRLWGRSGFEIVSGLAAGPDTLAVQWAEHAGFAGSVVRFPAEWNRYGRSAGPIRNTQMSWYGTHLLAFWDGKSSGTRHMIETAQRDGLRVRVIEWRPA